MPTFNDNPDEHVDLEEGREYEPQAGDERISAKVGPITFDSKFDDPIVDVVQKYRSVEHDVVSEATGENEYVVQHMGKKPPEITVSAIIEQWQLQQLEDFQNGGPIYLRTVEWTGTVIPKRVTQKPRREKVDGEWLYDVTFKLIGKKRGSKPGISDEDEEPDTMQTITNTGNDIADLNKQDRKLFSGVE